MSVTSSVSIPALASYSVKYNANGGSYASGSSYAPKSRTNLDVATNIAVSNRMNQGSSNWNDSRLGYAYVPYKVGYNFKGWKAVSADPAVNGKTYFPGQTVSVKANIEFVAQWEACGTASLDTQYNVGTIQGGYTFYPGQIYFYKFTPNRNMYVTGYTNAGPILRVINELKYYGDKLLISELENLYNKGFTHVIVTL